MEGRYNRFAGMSRRIWRVALQLDRFRSAALTRPPHAEGVAVLHLRRDAIRLVLADGAEHGDRAGIRR